MLNPDQNFVKSEGIDLPILTVYLAGRIAGDCIDKCLKWRQDIIAHYRNYKGRGAYPIVFLDALNSKEADSIDSKGLTSAIPPNLIYDKDLLSVERADVVVAMMDDYMEEGIENILFSNGYSDDEQHFPLSQEELFHQVNKLKKVILNRRPNWGTDSEVAWALYLKKPLILIAGNERQKAMLDKHPFMKKASVIVSSVDELLDKKWLQILYKSIAGATY
jgi:hypothetical protein